MRTIQAKHGGDGERRWATFDLVRDDGVQVRVEITCTATAEAVARANGNTAALEATQDPEALAQSLALSVQAGRGVPVVVVFFDEMDRGDPRRDIVYPD